MKLNKYIETNGEYSYLLDKISKMGNIYSSIMVGPTGCAKTLLALTLARELGCYYEVIDGNKQIDRRDFEGTWEITGKTIFNDGPILKCIDMANKNKPKPAFIIINEVNDIMPSEQISMNSILSEGHINLISKNGERHELDEDAKLVVLATMNLGVLGINPLQEAFLNRFEDVIDFEYPQQSIEVEIIKSITNCKPEIAQLLSEMASKFRESNAEDGEGYILSNEFSTRLCIQFANALKTIDKGNIERCIRYMIINKLSINSSEKNYVSNMLYGSRFIKRIKELL